MVKSKKIIKAFIASASDCGELRKASINAIDEINQYIKNTNTVIDAYVWENCKEAGFVAEPDEYQNQIFNQFGRHCDIFIIFFWTKLGDGTKKEYEFFRKVFVDVNPDVLFLGCHYGKEMSHDLLSSHRSYYDLMDFLKENDSHWSPLGRVRRGIKNRRQFEKELRTEIVAKFFKD